ncbi:hotdog family protein [Streptomyces griseiscabiei]|uniref:Uncharacterized protein n=1 Tax=Streptomyces griseiscabiei TaxID=2993540 RepID=A0ABU4L3Q7_9ACTN|nr:hypothetical protein [Streptomyces griseiscabiei]MBZ3901490.1 hypothetical protein [Streptomyces griseiscabiei]MDX2909960.1 hypothetical protein [Streptomyces griseiscabiei]
MGILSTDGATTLSVSHPSEAPTLLDRTFVTPWFVVDDDRTELFEKASYHDEYPHTYEGEDGYGDGLVEGFHLLSLLDVLCNHSLWSEGPWIAWNYGLDNVRFISVIRTTDPFRVHGHVREVIDRAEQGHLVVTDLRAEVKGRERPGFVATQRALWATA